MDTLTAALIAVEENADLLRGAAGENGTAGANGQRGDRGEPGLVWRGAWKASAVYAAGDVVEFEGSAYVAVAPTKGVEPPKGWDLLAKKGEDGQTRVVRVGGGGGSSGGAPSGAAGGDLSGTYPNPAVVNDSHSHTQTTGGLPSQWTAGASGNVTATTSDNSSPLSLVAPDEGGPGYDQAYALMIAPESLAWQGAIYINVGDQANLTADAYIIRAVNETNARQVWDIDAWGSMSLSADVDGGGGLDVKAGNNVNVVNVVAGTDTDTDSRIELRAKYLRHVGAFILKSLAAFADADLNASEVQFWFDDTNGAASPKWKGKSANGTVVSGSLGLPGSSQTYTESNVTTDRAFNANATSIDELADVLGTLIVDLRARGVVA